MTTEQQLEQEIQAKGLNAPRLTPALIDSVIVADQYWQPEGTTLTVCVLTLANFTNVVGESACVSAANFDAEIGKKIAYENARQKVWALEGYLLKQNLCNTAPESYEPEPLKVGDKVISIAGATRVGVTGAVEVIRSEMSVGVRTDNGNLWHEQASHWKKVA